MSNQSILTLSRYEILEACNDISKKYSGRNLGCVQGYRNQWLISVELQDMRQFSMFGAMMSGFTNGENMFDDVRDHVWLRFGFCQTQITRAPDGGFELQIEYDELCRCRTISHITMLFESWIGLVEDRDRKYEQWEKAVDSCKVDDPGLALSFQMLANVKQEMVKVKR